MKRRTDDTPIAPITQQHHFKNKDQKGRFQNTRDVNNADRYGSSNVRSALSLFPSTTNPLFLELDASEFISLSFLLLLLLLLIFFLLLNFVVRLCCIRRQDCRLRWCCCRWHNIFVIMLGTAAGRCHLFSLFSSLKSWYRPRFDNTTEDANRRNTIFSGVIAYKYNQNELVQ